MLRPLRVRVCDICQEEERCPQIRDALTWTLQSPATHSIGDFQTWSDLWFRTRWLMGRGDLDLFLGLTIRMWWCPRNGEGQQLRFLQHANYNLTIKPCKNICFGFLIIIIFAKPFLTFSVPHSWISCPMEVEITQIGPSQSSSPHSRYHSALASWNISRGLVPIWFIGALNSHLLMSSD